ncbi:hypothetical protein CMU40_14560 [Elizabethkingia anophelis]|nr:hypothetical protein [Elizabethkingia anophelis]MDV3727407.1 hypothetical protein [Elizabethkingia anophelis]MDV3728436.1 hypothetical protein [Elizabethkingia anophelis]MDV3743360.1 hypothetical protein [Elizabethkingia anophelis]MDV3767767.1 hypothetical protein [Elizabethkingia anophelis]
MKVFIENPTLLIEEFNKVAKIAQKKAFITIGIEIQKEEIEAIKVYRSDLDNLKKQFVERRLENEANLVYCIDNSLLVIQYELQMLVNIKEDKMHEAWGNLVNAQVTYGTVMRNFPFEFDEPNEYTDRLDTYEKLLFPKMFFLSTGSIIKKSHCSICEESFNKCDHIKGRLYNGELCTRIITEAEIEEASFVDTPANKHCRAISTSYDGKTIDLITLREIQTSEKG